MTTSKRVATLAVALVVLCTLAPVAGLAGTANAATTAPPDTPAAYYGQVLVNGQPAPAGVELVAVVDGEVRGSVTTGEDGTYGGAGSFDEKLEVSGDKSEDAGATVSFRVAGAPADTTTTWESGDHREVDVDLSDTAAPTATAAVPGNASVNQSVSFDASGSSDDTGIAGYEWTVDGQTLAGESVTHAFGESGEYDVTLTVTDLAGQTATTATTVSVSGSSSGGSAGGGGGGGGQGGSDDGGYAGVKNWTLSDSTPTVGQQLTLTVVAANPTSEAAEVSPELWIDDEELEAVSMTLYPGQQRSAEFTFSFEDPGEHTISGDGLRWDTVTVSGTETTMPDTTTADPGTDDGPGTTPSTTDEPTVVTGTERPADSGPGDSQQAITETGGGLDLWQIGLVGLLAAAAGVAALLVRWG
ncbi:PKD domain-containing protein [Haloarchaeobius sp. DFWS5]|uniref:PKD domain-containing protein n=1 Tax=Haloarchaeobius sp. DFWS5 TaxID=3446114 RepID=UPI003EB8FE80